MHRRDFLALGAGLIGEVAMSALPSSGASEPGAREALQGAEPILARVRNGRLEFRSAWCEIQDWQLSVETRNETLRLADAEVHVLREEPLEINLRFPKQAISWDVRVQVEPAKGRILLHSAIRNESERPVTLGRVYLLQTDNLRGFLGSEDEVVYLPMSSGQQLNQVRPLSTTSATSDIAIQAFNQNKNKALQVGFATFVRSKTQVEHRRASEGDLALKAWCDFGGWELPPASSTPIETLTLAVGKDPHAQLAAWGDVAARLCQVRPRRWEEEPNGWLGWSWVYAMYVERYEDVVLRNAKSIRQRLSGFGINYVWVSIGNLADGQPGAWLTWNERNFPSGHKYLEEELAQHGLKWGLWCGAFMLSSRLQDQVKELWDALFKQPDGKQPMVYLSSWGYGLDSPTADYHKPVYALDPSHPKTQEFLAKVFRTYREWGVRYYMIDFLWAGSDTLGHIPHATHYDKTLVSGPEVFQKGLQVIRAACGDDTHLLAATGPTFHTAGAMDAVRTGNDFGEGRPLTLGFPTYPGTFAIRPPDYWNGPVHALTNQAANYYTHRRLYINNSGNVLTVDKPLPLNQAQVNTTIQVMSGGPSMLGDDITYIQEERLELIKKTLPRPREVATPVDLFTRKEQGYPRVYHRKILQPWGPYDVVAVYNLENSRAVRQKLDPGMFGLDQTRTYHVWEFWNAEYLGKIHGPLVVEIPPLTVKVYRLTEDLDRPVILGTDMHILMGEMEVDTCSWDHATLTLSGRAIRPRGENGSVFLYCPPEFGVANPKGYFLGKDINNGCLVIRCPLRFDEGSAEWNVRFFRFEKPAPSAPAF